MAKKVRAPKTYSPGNGRPLEHLAYLNRQEMDYLRALNGGYMERGPRGLPSFAEESLAGPGGNKGGGRNASPSGNVGGGGGSSRGNASGGTSNGSQRATSSPTSATSSSQAKTFDRSQTMMTDANGVSYDYNGNVVRSAHNPKKSNSFASPNFPSTVNLDRQVQNQTQVKDAIQAVKNTPAIRNSSAAGGVKSINVGPVGTTVSVGAPKNTPVQARKLSPVGKPSYAGPSVKKADTTPEIEKTYGALRSSLVTSDPRIKNLSESMPGVKFAVERRLMSDVQPQIQNPQKEALGIRTLGSFEPSTGVMYVDKMSYGDPLAGPDPFTGYGPRGDISDIFAHEVAGHGTTEALSANPYAQSTTIGSFNKDVKSMAGYASPSMTGPGTWYGSNMGDEVLARLAEKEAAEVSGDFSKMLDVEDRLGQIAPSIYGGEQFGDPLIGPSPVPTGFNRNQDIESVDYLEDVYRDREAEAQRLLESGLPTRYEISRGIADLPTNWDVWKSVFTGSYPIYRGWTPQSYSEYMLERAGDEN